MMRRAAFGGWVAMGVGLLLCLFIGPLAKAVDNPSNPRIQDVKEKAVTKTKVGIDYEEALEKKSSAKVDPIAGEKIKITSIILKPPAVNWSFKTFPDDASNFVEVVVGLGQNSGINTQDAQNIEFWGTAPNDTADFWPVKAEGNLLPPGGVAGTPPHWSAKVSGMTASESVIMTAYTFSDTGLAVGTKGNGGTSYDGVQVRLTQGDISGAGTITVSTSCNWVKRGVLWGEATLHAPSLWVSKQANGIDATITVTNITVTYYNFWEGGYTDTGTSADMTLTMKGGNTAGAVTGTWTSPPTPTVLTFGALGITYTFSGTRSVTINSH